MLCDRLGKELLLFDGAMGTMLQKTGLKSGEIPETYNIDHKDIVVNIHKEYLNAGADFITTNTFGCNPLKMKNAKYSYKDMINAGIDNALKAKEFVDKEVYVVLDIGPIGTMLEPVGTLSFDDAYDIFKSIVDIGKDRVDAILIETMSDVYELKAALLAAKGNSQLPIFATMTFESHGRSLTGSDPLSFIQIAEGLGVDAIGVNCSLGPVELKPIIEQFIEYAHVPILIQPNAGLPCLKHGCTYYTMSAKEFALGVYPYLKKGISLVGGCCGTTPDFILELYNLNVKKVNRVIPEYKTAICSYALTHIFDNKVLVCGERMNPTGKKKLKEALLTKQYDAYVKEGIKQYQASADILDLNTGIPGIDEAIAMVEIMKLLQEVVQLPLVLDSSSPEALSKACRYYNGKPLINSVNGKDEVMEAIFPIVKKYGGVVIGLTLDDDIPMRAIDRYHVAKKIVDKAKDYGIKKEDIIIDCLTLTASAKQEEVKETLLALKMIREQLGVHTVLGVSNVSFGLPKRSLLNRTFLTLAMYAGLDLAIINPLDQELMDTIDAYNVLMNIDKDCKHYISHQSDEHITPISYKQLSLQEMIIHGFKDEIEDKTKELLKEYEPMQLINDMIIPSLNQVGQDYELHKVFLPQLIQSAETTKMAFEVIKDAFPLSTSVKKKMMICTVEGDVHDIGKNIVKVVLESYGYEVIDLGKDVKAKDVVEAYDLYKPDIIGLSALMTTTIPAMEKTIRLLKEHGCSCPISVGGAVLSEDIARDIKADYYREDALGVVSLMDELFKND